MNAPDIDYAPRQSLLDNFRSIIGFAEDLLHSTSGKTSETLDAVGARFGDTFEAAKAGVESAQAMIVESTKEAVQATDQYVHEHPWKAVGIGAGIGLIVGWLLTRR